MDSFQAQPNYDARRLNDGRPIITREHFLQAGATEREAHSINGPSVVRLPNWLPRDRRADPSAAYYMYFAHHGGAYIRMAWAENPVGPWHLYNVSPGIPMDRRGVLAMTLDRHLPVGRGLQLFTHIASPEVLVDDERQRFVLFFHGRPEDNDRLRPQATVPAVSDDGLDFRDGLVPCSPGNAYLRVFQASGRSWGLGGLLRLYRGPESSSPTDEQGLRAPEDFPVTERHYWQELPLMDKVETEWAGDLGLGREGRVRHLALRPLGEGLFDLFYTVKCASPPERILATRLDARSPDWTDWTVTAASEVMRPERAWEGANEPCVTSEGGAGSGLNQLRDPYVLENEGRIYLYYSGAGETAIGVAELTHD